MLFFIPIFAPTMTQQVVASASYLDQLAYQGNHSSSQHVRIKGSISRAEVMEARDKRDRKIVYNRVIELVCFRGEGPQNTLHQKCKGGLSIAKVQLGLI